MFFLHLLSNWNRNFSDTQHQFHFTCMNQTVQQQIIAFVKLRITTRDLQRTKCKKSRNGYKLGILLMLLTIVNLFTA